MEKGQSNNELCFKTFRVLIQKANTTYKIAIFSRRKDNAGRSTRRTDILGGKVAMLICEGSPEPGKIAELTMTTFQPRIYRHPSMIGKLCHFMRGSSRSYDIRSGGSRSLCSPASQVSQNENNSISSQFMNQSGYKL